MGSKQRLSFLDGIRGWAAFSVLLWHTFSETFGHLYPVFKSPYLIFVMQGHLDVMVFFVLSGQALSISFIRKKDPLALLSLAIKRYPRLAIPSFFSCLLSLAVIGLGFNFAGAAGAIVHSDWLARFLQFQPDLWGFLREVFYTPFFTKNSPIYNIFLWTMHYELVGSLAVFFALCLYMILPNPVRVLMPVTFASLCFVPGVACFFVGILLAHFYASGFFDNLETNRRWKIATYAALPVIIAAVMLSYKFFGIATRLEIIIAGVIILAIQTNALYMRAVTSRLSLFLGRISFPLYLVHFSVISSLTSWLIILADKHGILTFGSSLLIGFVTVIVSLVLACLFLPVETLTTKICNALSQLVFKQMGIKPAHARSVSE